MKKYLIIVSVILAAALCTCVFAATLTHKSIDIESGVSVYVDGEKLSPSDVNGNAVDVFTSGGTTYLPARAISEALGCKIDWNDAEARVDITTDSNKTADAVSGATQTQPDGKKILVAYFSREGSSYPQEGVDAITSASLPVGNTKLLAEHINSMVGGDLFQIITEEPYPGNYLETTEKAQTEKEQNARPALSTHVDNMDEYDVIFIGYPTWWSSVPMPIYSFLEEYDLSGKTVIPFRTHHEGSVGTPDNSEIKALCPNSNVLTGISVPGSKADSSDDAVRDWLDGLDY